MAIAEFNDICRDTFSQQEQKEIENFAQKMFKTSAVRGYLPIGKKEVCLERQTTLDKTLEVFLMNGTLEMNNELVNRFNKRNKGKPK